MPDEPVIETPSDATVFDTNSEPDLSMFMPDMADKSDKFVDDSAADTLTPEPKTEDKTPAEEIPDSEKTSDEVDPKSTEPTDEVAPVVDPGVEAAKAAVLELAKALGITETDVAKIPALVAEQKTASDAQRAAADALELEAINKQYEERIVQTARESVEKEIHPFAMNQLAGEVQAAGFEDPENYSLEGEWWNGPNGDQLLARYNAIKQEVSTQPVWQTSLNAKIGEGKAALVADQAKFEKLSEQFPHHNPEIVRNFRKWGFTPDLTIEVAKATHVAAEQLNSMLNSEVQTLRTQVSGHADALAKARSEGLAEGRQAALDTIKEGRENNPAQSGGGGLAKDLPVQGIDRDPDLSIFTR